MALKWAVQRPKLVETQPVEANNLIYTEGNDGYEVALNLTGSLAWQQFVGTATDSCDARAHGASTTATVADETIGGNSTSVLYTGGFANGQAELYALNALSGTIIWQRPLGDSVNTDTDMWSSPLVYNGSVYVGVASASDCPLVQGKLVQMDATNGAIQNTFKATPDGCIGPGIWGSPTLDTAATSTATVSSPTTSVATSTATVYVATGNGPTSGSCSPSAPVYAESLVALNATDLRVLSSWQVPSGQQVNDGDFGSTPTLFTANMNGQQHSMVGLVNKNGIYYAFDRANLGPGPVWQTVVSVGGPSPEYGGGSVAPSAWDGSHLYVAGGTMSYGGSSCASLLQALDPSTGKSIWADCLSTGPVLGAVTAAPGIVEVGAGNAIYIFDSSSGKLLYTYVNAALSGDRFQSAGSISNGVLYQGDVKGYIYALAPTSSLIQTTASLSGTQDCNTYSGPVMVTLSASESGGTIKNTVYQLGSGPVTTYTGPFQISGSGNHTLTFHSTDTSGNVEPARTKIIPIGPQITLNVVKGPYGTTVPVTGTTFQAGETVNVYWDSATSTPVASTVAKSNCSISTSFKTPQAALGAHSVIARGVTSQRSDSTPFTTTPSEVLSNSGGKQGLPITVTAYGFRAGEKVNVYWNAGSGTSLGSAIAAANGTTPAITVTVPVVPYGTYHVYAVGAASGASAGQSFKVNPTLTVSPTSGATGSSATVSGTGYGAKETVTIRWDCSTYTCTGSTVLGTAVTDAAGNFGGSSKVSSVRIVIPRNATHVTHTLAGKGTVNSNDFKTATYKVT